MRYGLRAFVAVGLVVMAGGCEGTGTASGKPDIVLRAVDRACFRDTFLSGAVTDGYRVVASSDVQLSLARSSRNLAATALFGTGQGLPEERLTVTLIPIPGTRDTRAVIDGAFVSNPGTAFEQRADRRFTASEQQAFVAMGRRAEQACPAR